MFNSYSSSPYNLRSTNPEFAQNGFAQQQSQNTDFDPYTTDNFAQNIISGEPNRQPYIEGVNQGQVGNPMLGQVSEGSLYPIQSSTDMPYLNNTGYSNFADGGRVNDLANNARSRLNILGLSQLMRNYASDEREHTPGFVSYAEGGHVESPEFEEEFDGMPMVDASQFNTDMEQSEEYKLLPGLAEIIRQQGEGEDTILAHINPIEAAVLKSMGGSGTINPKTGLPQFRGGFFSARYWNKGAWKRDALAIVGNVIGNMILPGIGGPIGAAAGSAAGTKIRGRKDYAGHMAKSAALAAAAPTAASLLGSGASSMGAGSVGNYLTNYGNTNAILPSLGIGNSAGSGSIPGVQAGETAASTVSREAGKKAVEQSFADKLMVNSKDFFTQPSNIMSTAVLANQLIPQKEKKVKETTPEEIAANEKRYRNASRLSQSELEAEAAYSLAQREAKRRARNDLYGLESSSVTPLYRKVNSPAEYENTRRWLEYYDNPEFTGNQVRMKEGGSFNPYSSYETEYPMGIIGYLNGYSGGQDDDINAKLSDGEYVIDASTVSDLGDGNNANGAKKLDQMRRNIRVHKRGGSIKMPPKAHSLLSYMRG
jgi:hypothetical protein